MKAFVIDLLKSKLPSSYYYHDYEHTLYVMDKAVEIGQHQNCTEKEIELLVVASLWHDTGFINVYDEHEKEGCALAKKYLPEYGYSNSDINKICGMIMATKIPQSPKNKLEEIIADADLEYLGTDNASAKANDLFKELQSLNPSLTNEQWNKTQIAFLQKHHYFTKFCKENTAPGKAAYLISLSVS
jgi:predicted metal-dependent HD superfamily phosphohydrolase